MNKNRQIISELKDFFRHNDSSKAVNAVNKEMGKLVIQAKTVGPVKNPNCKFTFVQLVRLLVLYPFFSVKTPADYADSALGKLFSCKKDTFYRLMDDGTIQHYRALDGMKDSYAFWAKMYREGILDQSIYTGTNSMELFVTGKTGMMMNNCYASQIQYVLDQIQINYPEAEVGIMQLPAGELGSHQITGTPYLDYTAISSTAEDPERIAAILDYILSPEGQNLLRNGIEGIHYTTNADGTITKNVEECKKEKFGAGEYGPHWIMGLVYSDPYYISDDFEYLDFFNENKKRLEDALNTDYFITMFAPLDGYSSDVTDKYLAKFNELYNQFDQKFIMGELEVNDENWQFWKDTIESEAHYSELVEDWTNAYREYEAAQSD